MTPPCPTTRITRVCLFSRALDRVTYGSMAHVLNMCLYLLGQLPLTYLTLALRPSVNTTSPGQLDVVMVPISFSEVLVRRSLVRSPGSPPSLAKCAGVPEQDTT